MKLHRSHKGFTLIELLVVISIIAILASFAVPAVTRGLVEAQLIASVNNVRQIHQSTMSMAIDGATNSDSSLGWPGDLKDSGQITDLKGFVTKLVVNDYLKPSDLKVFANAGITSYPGGTVTGSGTTATMTPDFTDKNSAYKVYLVHDNDPSNTLFLATKNFTFNTALDANKKPFADKGFVVIRKGGDASKFKKAAANSATGASYVSLIGNVPLPATATDPSQPGTEDTTNCFQTGQ